MCHFQIPSLQNHLLIILSGRLDSKEISVRDWVKVQGAAVVRHSSSVRLLFQKPPFCLPLVVGWASSLPLFVVSFCAFQRKREIKTLDRDIEGETFFSKC